jgi:hypothetical protein
MRRARGPERNGLAVGAHQKLSVDLTAIEVALHRHRLILVGEGGTVASRPGIDQDAARAVIEHKLIAEQLGNLAFGRNHRIGLHLADGGRLQQHDLLRHEPVRQPGRASAAEGANGNRSDQCGADQDVSATRLRGGA